MRIATRKSLSGLRPDQKSDIESIFGKDFTKKGLTTRMRILAEFDKKIDINEAMEEDPEKVLQFKLDAMSKSVGKAMIGPMNSLLDVSLKVVDGLDDPWYAPDRRRWADGHYCWYRPEIDV